MPKPKLHLKNDLNRPIYLSVTITNKVELVVYIDDPNQDNVYKIERGKAFTINNPPLVQVQRNEFQIKIEIMAEFDGVIDAYLDETIDGDAVLSFALLKIDITIN